MRASFSVGPFRSAPSDWLPDQRHPTHLAAGSAFALDPLFSRDGFDLGAAPSGLGRDGPLGRLGVSPSGGQTSPQGIDLLGLVMALLSRYNHGGGQKPQNGQQPGGGLGMGLPSGLGGRGEGRGCGSCRGTLGADRFQNTRSLGQKGWSPTRSHASRTDASRTDLAHAQNASRLSGSSAPQAHGLSQRSIQFIKQAEGYDQPGRWPGASSGITIGVGYDLGHVSRAEFRRDWSGKLPESTMRRLESAIGKKGQAPRAIAGRFSDIRIPRSSADQVFEQRTLPKFVAQTRRAFPGFDRLNPDQKGALTSLVFNRGPGMAGPRRREMRALRAAVARGDVAEMARQIRSMKRLWAGRRLGGLLRRRDGEARLIASA